MREIVLCRYSYDPLDRLVGILPLSADQSQRFYCKAQLTTEIQGVLTYSIFQHEERHLAQQHHDNGTVTTNLLATDQQRSVLHILNGNRVDSVIYTPYGHRSAACGLLSLLAFNGERRDPVTGHYLLGNGHRAFNPVLMRFNSPDALSPFGPGGPNCYTYCSGSPINREDSTGRIWRTVSIGLQKPLKRLVRGAQAPVFRSNELSKKPKVAELNKPTLLTNTRADRFLTEYKAFKEAIITDPFVPLNVTSAEDLRHLGGSLPRRFVFTEKGELLIDPSVDLRYRGNNHAILASIGGSDSGVISAGTISANTRQATIWNDSGHFLPPFSTLKPAALFLEKLNVEVTSVRMLRSLN